MKEYELKYSASNFYMKMPVESERSAIRTSQFQTSVEINIKEIMPLNMADVYNQQSLVRFQRFVPSK